MRLEIASIFAITSGNKPADDPEYGVANLFDTSMNERDDTYWLSDGGERNWIIVTFARPVDIEQIWMLSAARHRYPRRVPTAAMVYALLGENKDFELVGRGPMYNGSNRIELAGAYDVRELLISFPDLVPVLVNRLVVQGRAPVDIDQTKTMPRIAAENRVSLADFLAIDPEPRTATLSPNDCEEFEVKLIRCGNQHGCVSNLINRIAQCVESWTMSDSQTASRFLETHRFLLTRVRISALEGCPRYFHRWGGRGSCQYDHTILVHLENQFPDSKALHDAAWLSAQNVSKYYECEGNWDCVIESNLYSPRWFLEQFPVSAYSEQAVELVIDTIDLLDQVESSGYHYSGTYNLAEEISTLKALAPRLQPALSSKLLSGLALLESRLQDQFPDLPIFYEPDWLRSHSIVKHPDCGNYWDCVIENHLYAPRWFLERHRDSPYTEKALKRALEAIDLFDEMDLDEYDFSRTDNLSDDIEFYKPFVSLLPRELANKLRSGLERIESRLEVEELRLEVEGFFVEITSGNPSRDPLQYMSYAQEELIESFLQSNLNVAPEPKDEWMTVLFEIAEVSPHSNVTQVLCRFAESRFEAVQGWLLEYFKLYGHLIDPSRCHPDLARRVQVLIDN